MMVAVCNGWCMAFLSIFCYIAYLRIYFLLQYTHIAHFFGGISAEQNRTIEFNCDDKNDLYYNIKQTMFVAFAWPLCSIFATKAKSARQKIGFFRLFVVVRVSFVFQFGI